MTDLMNLSQLLRMARDTVANPREGAAQILGLGLPRAALWLSFALVMVLSTLLGEVVMLLMGTPADLPPGTPSVSPLTMGLLQGALLLIIAHAMAHIGRFFGGTGSFPGALALVVWMQFIFLVVQVIQILAMMIVPPVAGLILILAFGLFFWLLVNFTAELHGFTSLGSVFVMTILSAFAILFGLSLVLVILGVGMGPL